MKHLEEYEIMQILQKSPVNKKSIFEVKKDTLVEKVSMEHLMNCSMCMNEVWNSYISFSALTEKNSDWFIKAKLQLDKIKNTFDFHIIQGLALPQKLVAPATVRSTSTLENPMVCIQYCLVSPDLPGQIFYLQIEAADKGFKFMWTMAKKFEDPYTIYFYQNDKISEKQNLSKKEQKTEFFIEYTTVRRISSVSFKIHTSQVNETKLIRISL